MTVAVISRPGQSVLQSSHPHYLARDGFMPDWPAWSVQEASEKTGYSEEYLRRLIREDKLETTRIGRVYLIRVSSLQAYIQQVKEAGHPRSGPRSK